MKIYGILEEVPTPDFDYINFDAKKIEAQENQHKEDLKKYLIECGYDKPLTGEILEMPVADGAALYMVMDGGRQWGLVHLEYCDAYHSRDVEFLPKSEVKKRIESQKKIKSMFS